MLLIIAEHSVLLWGLEWDISIGRDLQESSSPTLTASGPIRSKTMLLRALSKWPLNTDGSGASTISLGSLFQCLATLSAKKSFLMSTLTLPGTALNYCHASHHWVPGKQTQHIPFQFPSSGSCREQGHSLW